MYGHPLVYCGSRGEACRSDLVYGAQARAWRGYCWPSLCMAALRIGARAGQGDIMPFLMPIFHRHYGTTRAASRQGLFSGSFEARGSAEKIILHFPTVPFGRPATRVIALGLGHARGEAAWGRGEQTELTEEQVRHILRLLQATTPTHGHPCEHTRVPSYPP